jgi:hypothetical protein
MSSGLERSPEPPQPIERLGMFVTIQIDLFPDWKAGLFQRMSPVDHIDAENVG